MAPTIEQRRDWDRRLWNLVGEMEKAFGEPGDFNQDVLDSAVHVATHISVMELRAAEAVAAQKAHRV